MVYIDTLRLARFLPSTTHHRDSAQSGQLLSHRDTPWNTVISPWRIAVSVSALSGNWSHGGPPRSRWTTAIAVDHHGLGGSRWNTCATTTLYKCTVCNIELYMFIHIADRIMLFFFKLCMYMFYMPFIIKSPNVQPFSLVFALFTKSLTCLTSEWV